MAQIRILSLILIVLTFFMNSCVRTNPCPSNYGTNIELAAEKKNHLLLSATTTWEDPLSAPKFWLPQTVNNCQAFYQDNKFHLKVLPPQTLFISSPEKKISGDNFVLEISGAIIQGASNSTAGVIFRRQENKFYMAGISFDGFYSLAYLKKEKINWIKNWTYTHSMEKHKKEFRLKIIACNNILRGYANDKFLFQAEDARLLYGNVGLFAQNLKTSGIEVAFSDFSLKPIFPDTFYDIYYEDFSSPTNTPWIEGPINNEGSITFPAGKMLLSLQPAQSRLIFPQNNHRQEKNFVFRVDFQHLSGPLDNGYGVVFNYIDKDNYYYFAISSDGFYQIRRWCNGQENIIVPWKRSYLININTNQKNHIEIHQLNNYANIYINNEFIQRIDIQTPNKGEIALILETMSQGKLKIAVDNWYLASRFIGKTTSGHRTDAVIRGE